MLVLNVVDVATHGHDVDVVVVWWLLLLLLLLLLSLLLMCLCCLLQYWRVPRRKARRTEAPHRLPQPLPQPSLRQPSFLPQSGFGHEDAEQESGSSASTLCLAAWPLF